MIEWLTHALNSRVTEFQYAALCDMSAPLPCNFNCVYTVNVYIGSCWFCESRFTGWMRHLSWNSITNPLQHFSSTVSSNLYPQQLSVPVSRGYSWSPQQSSLLKLNSLPAHLPFGTVSSLPVEETHDVGNELKVNIDIVKRRI